MCRKCEAMQYFDQDVVKSLATFRTQIALLLVKVHGKIFVNFNSWENEVYRIEDKDEEKELSQQDKYEETED